MKIAVNAEGKMGISSHEEDGDRCDYISASRRTPRVNRRQRRRTLAADMKAFLDCIPCVVRQSLEAARLATADERIHEQVLREVLQATSQFDFSQPPPI